jgi:hypothetical protein
MNPDPLVVGTLHPEDPSATNVQSPAGHEPGSAGSSPPSAEDASGIGLDELAQEIRRVGRELFKANRATERNQELFESALGDLTGLGARVGDLLARGDDAAFAVKEPLCRELLEVADVLEASLMAARESVARLQDLAERPVPGLALRFAATRELREGLLESVDLLRQWAVGQELLDQRLSLALRSAGLRVVESVGQPFDPALHRAVGTATRPGVPAGTVLAEERKGYLRCRGAPP